MVSCDNRCSVGPLHPLRPRLPCSHRDFPCDRDPLPLALQSPQSPTVCLPPCTHAVIWPSFWIPQRRHHHRELPATAATIPRPRTGRRAPPSVTLALQSAKQIDDHRHLYWSAEKENDPHLPPPRERRRGSHPRPAHALLFTAAGERPSQPAAEGEERS